MFKKTIVIIPAFNEGRFISNLLKKLKKLNFENILVVDDGSTDNTVSLTQKEGVMVLKHLINRGMGAATQTGVEYGLRNGYEYFLTIDADGQQDPKDLLNILSALKNNKCVIGSRFLSPNKIPVLRFLANKFANFFISISTGLCVTDSQSGLRGFDRIVAQNLKLKSDGFEFCSDFIKRVYHLGIEIKEIPVSVQYNKQTMSKGQNLAEGLKTISKLYLYRVDK